MFQTSIKVRFNHVDPAGMVFYPRYYEMLNQVVEEWFEEKLGYDFRALKDKLGAGVPAVNIETNFPNASHLGDELKFQLTVESLGKSSIELAIDASVSERICLEARMTLIYVLRNDDGSIAPNSIPPGLRKSILAN